MSTERIIANDDKEEMNELSNYENSDIIEQVEEMFNQTEEQEDILININEFAQTKEYKVKVTKYEKQTDKFNRLEDGYEYVKFYLLVENLTKGKLRAEDVNCVVDGIAKK